MGEEEERARREREERLALAEVLGFPPGCFQSVGDAPLVSRTAERQAASGDRKHPSSHSFPVETSLPRLPPSLLALSCFPLSLFYSLLCCSLYRLHASYCTFPSHHIPLYLAFFSSPPFPLLLFSFHFIPASLHPFPPPSPSLHVLGLFLPPSFTLSVRRLMRPSTRGSLPSRALPGIDILCSASGTLLSLHTGETGWETNQIRLNSSRVKPGTQAGP